MRVKRGVAGHAKHVKIRKATKGFSHPNRVSVKRGRQAVTKGLQFATRDRKTASAHSANCGTPASTQPLA